jgi:hypothetical protein
MVTRFRIRHALFAALGVAATGATLGLFGRAPSLDAADPFVAGGLSTRAITTHEDVARLARTRGHAVVAALGIPSAREVAQRVDDVFDHRTYDEVTSFDAGGRPVAITRLGPDGSLAMTTVLDWHGAESAGRAGAIVDASAAAQQAAAAVRRLGLPIHGRPEVRASTGAGGWTIAWPRVEGGVPVRGDGLRVLLFSDGSFHGLVRTARPLAPAPAGTITPTEARRRAEASVARAGSSAGDLRVAGVELAWVAPTIGPSGSRLDAPAAVLRLAWVVRFDVTGPTAERLRARELWLDSADGSLLGDDAIE